MANIPLQSISFPGLPDKYTTPVVDNTLAVAGAAADAKKTGDEIGQIKNDLADMSTATLNDQGKALTAKTVENGKVTEWQFRSVDGSSGLTRAQKLAILNCFSHTAWTDNQGQTYYDELYNAFFGTKELLRISATYSNTNDVYTDTPLDDLRPYITVTAYYSDNTASVVNAYTLSGPLTIGTSTVTVDYEDFTADISVTVVEKPVSDMTQWHDGIPYTNIEIIENSYYNNGNPAGYNGWNRTGYIPIHGASKLAFGTNNLPSSNEYNFFFDENHNSVGKFGIGHYGGQMIDVPSEAYYFGLSWNANVLNEIIEAGFTPYA